MTVVCHSNFAPHYGEPMTTRMPAEWEPHERTWMAWPPSTASLEDLDQAGVNEVRAAWASVANAVARFEPITMVVAPDDAASARKLLDDRVELELVALDDCWMRDMGPTFVHDSERGLWAIDWIFNGWGASKWARWNLDANVAVSVAALASVPVISSDLVNEGGGIHVNGTGTVFATDTVQLAIDRNPNWTREQVEVELREKLGVEQVVWFPRGLTRDYDDFGTRGHVDIVACFSDENTVLYHDQRNPEHPDFEVSAEVRAVLEAAGDWKLIAVPAPEVLKDDHGWVDYSYINHYVCNGAVIACGFNDPNDAVVTEILAGAYPGREIVMLDARTIFSRGGGIHCITQQQPVPK